MGDVDIDKHLKGYIASYYGEDHITEIAECFRQYWQHALKYGEHEDDHAGEQFANHVARMLISQFMKDKSQRAEDLLWACDDKTLEGQVEWYKKLCAKGKESYEQLLCCYEKLDARLIDHERILFEDSLYLQAEIYYNCYSGALLMCEALCEAFAGEYKLAFYKAGKARKAYLRADRDMRDREHGKWHDFYANECLTDIKQTAWVIEGLMSYIRNLGDGPHFYLWQREFLYSEEDRRVVLVCNMENHLKDLELYELMEERYGDM